MLPISSNFDTLCVQITQRNITLPYYRSEKLFYLIIKFIPRDWESNPQTSQSQSDAVPR